MDSEYQKGSAAAKDSADRADQDAANAQADNGRARDDDDAIAADLPDFAQLSQQEIKEEFIKERKRFDRDLFKSQTMCRKLQAEVKKLQEINTANAKNTNNTSSQFSLPSEFKEKWNELVSEKILDAFPDFLDKYYLLVPLIQELFLLVGELLKQKQDQSIQEIARILNLFDEEAAKKGKKDDKRFQKHNQIMTLLHVKLQSVFQEHNKSIFKFAQKGENAGQSGKQDDSDEDEEDSEIKNIIQNQYKPRVLPLVEETNDGEFVDDFIENISSDDFVEFFKSIVDLSLHMFLNDPPILMDLTSVSERAKKEGPIQKFDFRLFLKSDYHCIDGFHTDNMPAVIVLPQPLRRGYTYQGIKPAVLVFTEDDFEELFPDEDLKNQVLQDIQRKQDEQEEAKRQKKALKEEVIKEEEPEKERDITEKVKEKPKEPKPKMEEKQEEKVEKLKDQEDEIQQNNKEELIQIQNQETEKMKKKQEGESPPREKQDASKENSKLENLQEKLTLQIPDDVGGGNEEDRDVYINTLDNHDLIKTPVDENESPLDDSLDDAPPEIERSHQPEVKHMRRSSTEASIRQSLNQVSSKSFLDKANDKLQLAIPSKLGGERMDAKNKTSDQGTPQKVDLIESSRHRRAESAIQLMASAKKANDNAENIADIMENIDNISDSQRQYLRQNTKNDKRAASGTRNLGLSTRDVASRSGSLNTGSKGYINNTRAELRSQIKQIKILEETIRQQQSTKQLARKSSNASQDCMVNSFRSSKMGASTQNDLEGKLAQSFSKSGTNGQQLSMNKQKTQITPVKILSKVPISVLEQRGSRPSPQGRHNEQQIEYTKVGGGSEGGRKGFSAFSNKAKGFSLVCEDLQKQIITFQNLTKKAQGSLRSNHEDRQMKMDADKQQTGHLQEQQPYLDQRYDAEKKSFDQTENQYSNSMYMNRNPTNQRIGEHLPCDRGETLPVHVMSGPTTLENFEESHYSWRSAAHNQRNQLGHFNQQQIHNKNDESKLYKDGDDTASFIEPNDNASISASASANYGNMNNQSSFSNLGKPPSSSYTKNQESIQAYKSKIQALKDKERNRQRQRSQNRQMAPHMDRQSREAGDTSNDHHHERSRSKSQTIRNIQKYTQELNKQREQQKGRNGLGEEQQSNHSQQRSISPYQRWKMMPRQITQPTAQPKQQSQLCTKNPYVNMPMSHASNPNSKDPAAPSGITGNPKNHRILQQFQESRGQQQYYGSELSGKEKGVQSQYRPQHQTLSSKYQYSHYIDHEKGQHQTMKPPREPDLHYMGMSSSSNVPDKMMPSNAQQDKHGGQGSTGTMSFLRQSQQQQRIVSGGESIPGATTLKSSQQLAAGYQSHHHLKQQIKNIKSSGHPGTTGISSVTPSSSSFNQMHHPLRNNFMDPVRYSGQQQQHTPQNGGQLTLTTQTSLTAGSKTAQEKIYEQQRKLQQRKQIQYEMATQGRGDTLSSSYHQMGQSEGRYGEGRDAALLSHFRSRPKNQFGGGRDREDDDSSSDDNDVNDRQRRSGVGLSKTFNTINDRSAVATKRASGTTQMHGSRVANHHQNAGGDDFNDRETKTKPGHTLIQQQYSRQNGHGKLQVSEAANERRLRQNFTLEQYKRKLGNTNHH